jgi:hypothetical protein
LSGGSGRFRPNASNGLKYGLAHGLLRFIPADDGGKPGQFDVGVGFEYWYNKFGNEAKYLPGTRQNAFFVEAGYHF